MGNQELRLLAHLKQHKTIQPMEAWQQLGIYRLAAVIHLLRTDGHEIETDRISVTNRFGEECKVARYIYRGKQAKSLFDLM